MIFDEDHKVICSTLTKEEARAFIDFLGDEVKRHKKCIEEADFMWCMRPVISEIYESALVRHEEDIVNTTKKMERVKGMFGL